jgi:hypothetical protein
MTEKIHSCSLYCDRPECIKEQRDDLRQKYFDLCDVHARSLNQAIAHGKWDANAKVLSFKERLAEAIENMPFGDTADSFAIYVRNFE